MMVRTLCRWTVVAVLIIAAPFARGDSIPKLRPIIEPAQWLAALSRDLLVPGYTELAEQARRLDAALRVLCASSDPKSLGAARERWLATASVWHRLEALPIGPTLVRRSMRRFNFWPTRTPQIEDAIARNPGSVEALARIGASAQGLPALEYLLFDSTQPVSGADRARCRYSILLGEALVAETQALAKEWRAWEAQWREAAEEEAQQEELTDVVNATIGALEQLRLRKLHKPMRALGRSEPLFESWRGGATREHLLATFDGLSIVLTGGASQIGTSQVLHGLGHSPLAERLEQEVRGARAAL